MIKTFPRPEGLPPTAWAEDRAALLLADVWLLAAVDGFGNNWFYPNETA